MATNGGNKWWQDNCQTRRVLWKWQSLVAPTKMTMQMVAIPWPTPKNDTQMTTNGHGWWQDHSQYHR